MFTLGLVQASAADPEHNIRTIHHFAAEASAKGCLALCFPEAFLTGYCPEQASIRSISRDSEELEQVTNIAVETNVDLLIGFMEKEKNSHFLTHALFSADGRKEFYRKTHLGEKEQQFFTAGDRLKLVTLTCGLRAGFQICVETHFPEISQTLSLMGAEIIFAPHAAPVASGDRYKIWEKIIPARSYDNRLYMACCNLQDKTFAGGCLATDPTGEIIAHSISGQDFVLFFSVDPDKIKRYHEHSDTKRYRYYPDKRRPELYFGNNFG